MVSFPNSEKFYSYSKRLEILRIKLEKNSLFVLLFRIR